MNDPPSAAATCFKPEQEKSKKTWKNNSSYIGADFREVNAMMAKCLSLTKIGDFNTIEIYEGTNDNGLKFLVLGACMTCLDYDENTNSFKLVQGFEDGLVKKCLVLGSFQYVFVPLWFYEPQTDQAHMLMTFYEAQQHELNAFDADWDPDDQLYVNGLNLAASLIPSLISRDPPDSPISLSFHEKGPIFQEGACALHGLFIIRAFQHNSKGNWKEFSNDDLNYGIQQLVEEFFALFPLP